MYTASCFVSCWWEWQFRIAIIVKLEKKDWHPYFDRVSKGLAGKRAEIQIAALPIGAQVEAEWMPVVGIVYDPKDDIVEIALENPDRMHLDHLIHAPREIYVDEGPSGLASMVIDRDGVLHIVQLRDPLMLPPPASH